jgi:hypothetical protein
METVHKLGQLIEEVSTLFTSIDIPSQINSLISENNKLKEEMKELIETHQNKCDELIQTKNKYDKEIGTKNKEIKEQKEELVRLTKISLIQQYDKQVKDKNDYIKILESQLEKYKNASKPQSPKTEPVIQVDTQDEVELANNKNSKIKLDIVTEIPVEKPIKQIESTITTCVNEKKKQSKKSKSEIVEPVEEIIQEPVEEKIIESNENEGVSKKKKKQKSEVQEEPVVENLESEKPKKKNGKKTQQEEDDFDPENFEDVNGYELIVYKGGYYLRDLETNELYDIKNNGPNQVVGLINSKGRVKFN